MMSEKYNPKRDVTLRYLETVSRWIDASSEVFIVLRYLGSGAKDYAFVCSVNDFTQLIDDCPTGTDIIVFRDQQLPRRGNVTEEFIAQSRRLIPDGTEYLCVSMIPESHGTVMLSGSMADTETDLIDDLEDRLGGFVAVGPCPPFFEGDNDRMISASKGGIDGPR